MKPENKKTSNRVKKVILKNSLEDSENNTFETIRKQVSELNNNLYRRIK
jgi:hypothetical protein